MLNLVQLFDKYRNQKIALYGLGTESEYAIAQLDNEFEIIGLLDGFKEEGELFGKPIVSLLDAVEKKVKLIIVVARPGSCKVIRKRIGDICQINNIDLLDIRGNNLLICNQATYNFSHISGVTKAGLVGQINDAEVVSFDLFDTLIMRQTLLPTDVIEYVNYKLQENGIYIDNFCKKRLKSEKELSQYSAPTLKEIYVDVMADCGMSEITPEDLADLEWKIDYELIIPRKDVCDIFKTAYTMGKKVYIVSDSYYSKEQLIRILNKCDIVEFTDVLSSSEYKTSKTQGLFNFLIEKEKGRKILHIGDDIVADVDWAIKYGIQTCRLYSGEDLLEHAGYLGGWDQTDTLSDRLKIGMFVSRIFNSPFQFETVDRRIQVADAYDIGYLFCAPMISDFVIWFIRQIEECKLEKIWFCARDGYLIRKMYREIKKEDDNLYFLTSRIAAIRAGVESEEDIRYVDGMQFSGSLEQNMKERFGIEVENINPEHTSMDEQGLLRYKMDILENARKEYKNYKKYINQLNAGNGDIAFFDFVAKGTSQMYIGRLVENHLIGFYFLQLEPEYMKEKGLDIRPFYSKEEKDSSAIFDNYYILETLLTAPHPSVRGFDENGVPLFAEETRTGEAIQCFKRAQDGILDYFKTYLKFCPKREQKENKKLDEVFLTLIHGIKILDENFLNLVVEDPFFNRMTNITDVL